MPVPILLFKRSKFELRRFFYDVKVARVRRRKTVTSHDMFRRQRNPKHRVLFVHGLIAGWWRLASNTPLIIGGPGKWHRTLHSMLCDERTEDFNLGSEASGG